MKVDEIRDKFLKFFEGRGHMIYPSDSLVPRNDPTLLFTGAGMNQFKEEFMGRVKGPRRAATCQKCLRTGDLDNVGKTPDHHTFFEMLGNFSFGDYFKKEAIAWAWEFLTKELGLKESDLWVSVYKDDEEAYRIWKEDINIPAGRIANLGEKDNFWPASAPSEGPNGPCGPCSEIFYGGLDGVEVWNLVFTQFDRKDGGRLDPLPNKNIDTGMGLERIAKVMQGKRTNFEIDSFGHLIASIKDMLAGGAGDYEKINAIADHIRAVTFAVGDGVLPSNEDRGYVIRKLIRRAFWYGKSLGLDKPFLYKLVPVVAAAMKKQYPELTGQREDISQVVLAEEKRFRNTIEEGLSKLKEMMDSCSGAIAGKDAFKLYDTYGFPIELTREIANAGKVKVDIEGFEECMEAQRAKSRASSKIKGSIFDIKGDVEIKLPEETVFMEDKEEITTEILKVSGDSVFLKETNFYGEKGGQVGDIGVLIKDGKIAAEVVNAIDIAGRVQHEIRPKGVELEAGDKITVRIDIKRREAIKKNHTATHLLHNALRTVLGEHVKQAGSLVAPDRLRFDFTHFKGLTDEELERVEGIVNKNIKDDATVDIKELTVSEAKKQGAIALFGEKYGERVRMVAVGDYSKELCGGTHVGRTGNIKLFKIISESSIAGGVRRIEAITSDAALSKVREEKDALTRIAAELNTAPRNVLKEVNVLTGKLKKLEKGLEAIKDRFAQSNIEGLLKGIKSINGFSALAAKIENADMEILRKSADIIKRKIGQKGAFVLVSEKEGKISMLVGAGPPLDAVKILNDIGSGFGIKGGGRPDFAQAGAKAGIDIKKLLKKAEEVIEAETR
ncbi:MAG: alanine--tRNA ligase [Candidatus Omnitrophica bacterium]|nr:alanine--tRNA ligase [Candidatus Omnitrophota bacterium]